MSDSSYLVSGRATVESLLGLAHRRNPDLRGVLAPLAELAAFAGVDQLAVLVPRHLSNA